MDAETITLREGDVYLWGYLEPGDDRAYGRYHCCSCFAVVKNGRLRDTYWAIQNSFGSDGRSFGVDDLPKLELRRLGNLSDLERKQEYEEDYYDDADIVDLNHANSSRGNFYLRKGAKRSPAKMLRSARRMLEKAESDARMAADRAERLRSAIAEIKAGKTDVYL